MALDTHIIPYIAVTTHVCKVTCVVTFHISAVTAHVTGYFADKIIRMHFHFMDYITAHRITKFNKTGMFLHTKM